MKTLIAALMLTSVSAFATEIGATDALLNTLPLGTYSGQTERGEACKVQVSERSSGIMVSVSANGRTKGHETKHDAAYRWQPGQRLFFNSTITRTSNSSTESFVRTIAVTERTQYVVAGSLYRSTTGNSESVIECVVDL